MNFNFEILRVDCIMSLEQNRMMSHNYLVALALCNIVLYIENLESATYLVSIMLEPK